MNKPISNSLAARDIAYSLHPYTNAVKHEAEGPVVITRGKGIFRRACAKSPDRKVVEEAIKKAQQAGLIVVISIILGVTGEETEAEIYQTVDWVIEQGVDFVQYSLPAALPGSILRSRMLERGRIITHNWEHYDGAWPTIKHPLLSPKQLIELLKYAYYRTYSCTGVIRRILGHPNFLRSLFFNYIVNRVAHRWWGKDGHNLGYEYWLNSGGIDPMTKSSLS